MFFDLSKSLVLYFFLILNKGESTGPKTSICLITVSFFLISCAALKLSWLELDEIIKLGKINAVFGSLLSRAEVKFKTKRPNLFCKNPLNYVLKTNLTESCDFKTIFVETAKKLLGNVNVKHKFQHLLTKGDQTAGNIFLKRDV